MIVAEIGSRSGCTRVEIEFEEEVGGGKRERFRCHAEAAPIAFDEAGLCSRVADLPALRRARYTAAGIGEAIFRRQLGRQ